MLNAHTPAQHQSVNGALHQVPMSAVQAGVSTAVLPSCSEAAAPAAPQAAVHSFQRDTAASSRERLQIADTLALIKDTLAPVRRMVHAGDRIYQAGDSFDRLYILNVGFCKIVNLSADGREQVVGLKFRGDWLGFDGIANGHYACDAIAMDTGEVWVVQYSSLLAACAREPALMRGLHAAMSREIALDRDSLMSVCTLPADARVAEFLRYWASSLEERGLRSDQISLRMTRAEIGNYLGMTLETVSRALSRLAREGLIVFPEKGRRELRIPAVGALSAFVHRHLAPAALIQ